jgi:signal peptidase I
MWKRKWRKFDHRQGDHSKSETPSLAEGVFVWQHDDVTQPPPIPTALRPKMDRPRRVAILVASLIICVGLLLLVVFIISPLAGHPLLKNFRVSTSGMDPTISKGDMIVAEGFSLWTAAPARGDVIVFRIAGIADIEHERGASPDTVFVQRIAALAGDTLELQPDTVLVNDVEFVTHSEGREIHCDGQMGHYVPHHYLNGKITVPDGHVFTLGDNTQRSSDGRYWGFLPAKNIQMRARWRISPSERRGAIH